LGLLNEAEEHLTWARERKLTFLEPLLLRLAAEVAAQRGEIEEAIFLVRKAIGLLERGGPPVELVQARCELGELLARQGQKKPACTAIEEALELAHHARLRWMLPRLRTVHARLVEEGASVF